MATNTYIVSTSTEFLNAIANINNANPLDDNIIDIQTIITIPNGTILQRLDNKTKITGKNYNNNGLILPINFNITINHHDFVCENNSFTGQHPGNDIGNDPNQGCFFTNGYNNAFINNCEFKYFSYYGFLMRNSIGNRVENCWIHHNRKNGLGYGLVLEGVSYVTAKYNLMEFNRHCIAGTGELGQGYTAQYNTFGESGNNGSSRLDMHGDGEVTGGSYIDISYNTFTSTNGIDIGIRGIPDEKIIIHNNYFAHKSQYDAIRQQQNQFRFGRLEFVKMEPYKNYYNRNNCSDNNISQQFLGIDAIGNAYQLEFNSDCYNTSINKKIGIGFNNYKNIFINDWFGFGKKDLVVQTTSNQFLLIKNDNGTFYSSQNIRINSELSNYNVLTTGNILTDKINLIGQKNETDIYEISINTIDGEITETLLANNTIKFDQLITGKFNNTRQSLLGYNDSSGTSVVFLNNGTTLDSGTTLGNFPNHRLYSSYEFIKNGFDDIVSYDGNSIYLWRFNSGTLLGGEPSLRSGNSGDIFDTLIPVKLDNDEDKLLIHKNDGDVEIFQYISSFSNSISIGAALLDKIYKF